MKRSIPAALFATLGALSAAAMAQSPPPAYGESVTLDQARKCMAAGEAEMKKNGWQMVITVVDTGGFAVAVARVDGAQYASVEISRAKAWAAAGFRRPTKVFFEGVGKGNTYLMSLPGVVASEGGIPIMMGGKIVGAVGVSGGTGQQDGVAAQACVDALK